MVKKVKKSKTAEQKARVSAKQNKKAAQREKKVKPKGADDSDDEYVDLEAVLEEYAKKQAQFLKVTETICSPPYPRSSATIIGSPSNAKELFLFGGEYYNGALANFYNDLYIYNIDRDEWRKVTSPNSPLPRSGHAWCRGGNAEVVYLFGGEFSSPKQGTFYHYNDFWRLEPSSREWTRLESKGKSPPARSGHRLVYYKNYIILFGGFQDTSHQTKYLQDLWIYDCHNYVWHNPALPHVTQKPDSRSSFSFHPHDSGAVLYGGYSRVKSSAMVGKQTKGGGQASKSIMKPTIHQDTWFLRITQPSLDAPVTSSPNVRWERRKKPVNSPNPPRAGATQVYHKGRGILFGGVHDVEESEEGIESEFFNEIFAFNLERNRFFPLSLRRPKAAPRKQLNDERAAKRGRGKADEAELLKNLAALEAKGNVAESDVMDIDVLQEEEAAPLKTPKPVLNTMPHPRFNSQLAVQGDMLYIFGGTFERGDREYTFDEMYAVDLGKLNSVEEIYRREPENWQVEDVESDSNSDEEDDSEDEDTDVGSTSGVALPSSTAPATPQSVGGTENAVEMDLENTESMARDNKPHPRPFESLREFFARTSHDWQEIILIGLRENDSAMTQSVKEVRKHAFDAAENKWWDCREEITAEEERQEEAGIGEVSSIADRPLDTATAGRRR